ncbi:MAG: hypothetical protein AAF626_13305 [Pseudomonadota bacterium]
MSGASDNRVPWAAVLVALAGFLALQTAAYLAVGGFEYPHDDPYIHLAIAEQITAGNYGVNAGEVAAAASSPLFPVLLTPFAGDPIQRYLPLAWNLMGLILAAWLWGAILARAGYRGVLGLVFALLGPIALNMVGLSHVGMEHMLHTAASLAIVFGLLRFVDESVITAPLAIGIALAPLLRFEGLALALFAALAVLLAGRRVGGAALVCLAILPLAAFCLFLISQGLEPLPSSVRAKLANPHVEEPGLLGRLFDRIAALWDQRREQILALMIALAVLFAFQPRLRPRRMLLVVTGLAALAHFFVGRFGWIDRYEIYILCALAAALLAVAALGRSHIWSMLVLVPMGIALFLYGPLAVRLYPGAGLAVKVQQAQMARFAKDYLQEPVAVNDLGYVAWANPNYVLDIWGLANAQALSLRLDQGAEPGWIGELTDAQDVRFAMVYDVWFSDELGADWRLLGQLETLVPSFYLGGDLVNFFLTDSETDPEPYRALLREWAEDLPPGARFEFSAP